MAMRWVSPVVAERAVVVVAVVAVAIVSQDIGGCCDPRSTRSPSSIRTRREDRSRRADSTCARKFRL
jgi:hypothetical protein